MLEYPWDKEITESKRQRSPENKTIAALPSNVAQHAKSGGCHGCKEEGGHTAEDGIGNCQLVKMRESETKGERRRES
jgi:hypothetical protein